MKKTLRFLCMLMLTLVVGAAQAEDFSGVYRIKGPRSSRLAIDEANKFKLGTKTANTTGNLNEMWEIRAIDAAATKYAVINVGTAQMVQTVAATNTESPTSATNAGIFYIKKESSKFIVSNVADFSDRTCWHEDGGNKIVLWSAGSSDTYSKWTFTKVSNADELAAVATAQAGYEAQVKKAIDAASKMSVLDNGGIFRIKSRYDHYMTENQSNHQVSGATSKKTNDLTQIWVVQKDGGVYHVRNAQSGRYMPTSGGADAALVTVEDVTDYYIKTSAYKSDYFTISWKSDFANGTCLHENAKSNVVKWHANNTSNTNQYSDWSIEPVDEADTEATLEKLKNHMAEMQGIASTLTTGTYTLVPAAYPDRALAEGNGGVTTGKKNGRYAQVWTITLSADGKKCTMQNLLTGKYVKNNASTSSQFKTQDTGTTGCDFTVGTGGGDWDCYFNFRGSAQGFHCASSANYDVVGWSEAEAASQWILYKVEVDEAALAAEREEVAQGAELSANAATYNTKLQKYFEDYACTQFREEYKTYTEAQLRAAMEADGLPTLLQNMAVNVLTSKWEPTKNDKYNEYVKLFRIQDVQIYSDNQKWRDITMVGPFGELTSPTGIIGKTGDYVFLFVEDNPKTSCTLRAMLANDTGYRNAGELALKKGLNVWQLPADGEVFVTYFLTDTNKHLSEYPKIRVHVEGGTVNGCWDASRGMTNADWTWLKANMFKSEFLHVKGENTVLNLLTENVKPATKVEEIMKGWDFAFMGLQKAIGHTGQWDDRYHPVVNPRHSYQGNPNWGGYGGSNHPGISSNYLFSFDNFYNDNVWEILHEIGHGCQYPIKMAGSTEVTNNSLSQIVTHMMGNCYSRGNGVDKLVQLFNYERDGKTGWSWLDYMRYAVPNYDASLHTSNHLPYQLYLYFEVMGHSPGFLTRMHNIMREDKIRTTGKGSIGQNDIATYNDDFWKFAKACATASQTNLWEFFETYGFWKYADEIISTSDDDPAEGTTAYKNGHRFVGDYGNYSMKFPVRGNAADEANMRELKEYMESMPNTAPNLFFVEDRIERQYVTKESFVGTMNPARVGKELQPYWKINTVPYITTTDGILVGDYGQYNKFDDEDRTTAELSYTIGTTTASQAMQTDKGGDWNYTVKGKKVTMKNDAGVLGIKIYSKEGKLSYIANTRTFIVPDAIATGLKNGDYVMHVAATGAKDIIMGTDGKRAGVVDGINVIMDAQSEAVKGNATFDLFGRATQQTTSGQIYLRGGKKFMAK